MPPGICFCAHLDTSPDCTGAGVKPIKLKKGANFCEQIQVICCDFWGYAVTESNNNMLRNVKISS